MIKSFTGVSWIPSSEWVLWMSLRSDAEVYNDNVFRRGKSIGICCSVELKTISTKYKVFDSVSLSAIEHSTIVDITVNYRSGAVTMRGSIERSVSLEDTVEQQIAILGPQVEDNIRMGAGIFVSQIGTMSKTPEGEHWIESVLRNTLTALHLTMPYMERYRRLVIRSLIDMDDVEYWKQELGSWVHAGEWASESHKFQAVNLWTQAVQEGASITKEITQPVFMHRCQCEHQLAEYVWGLGADPMLRLAKTRLSWLLNPYWAGLDRSIGVMYMLDFRIGLYDQYDTDVINGEQEDEGLMVKGVEDLRKLAIERWMSIHTKDSEYWDVEL